MSPATTAARSVQPAKATRDFLSEISTKAKPRPMAAVVFGPPGVGKTEFAAAIPGVVFLTDDKERGIDTLKTANRVSPDIPVLPPVDNWEDTLEVVSQLRGSKYRALAIDTLGGFERHNHARICETEFKGNWGDKGFASYAKGYEVSLPNWRLLLEAFDKLRDNGMSIVCLAHSLIRPYKNPEGEDYDRFIPDLHHKTWSLTHRWADMVLFANYHVEVDTDGPRPKGRGGQDRYFHTEYHPAFEAKNRHGLPAEIDMGTSGKEAWANLRTSIADARKVGG